MISIHLRGSVRAFATLTTELSVSHASGSRTIDCVVSKRSREGIEAPDDCCADRKKPVPGNLEGCTRITLKPDLSGNLNTSEKLILSIASACYTWRRGNSVRRRLVR